jgi:hypothetical protein
MPIMENDSPYLNMVDRLDDLSELAALQMLIAMGCNLTERDVDALDSITIRLLAFARWQKNAPAVDRFSRLRAALRARFSPMTGTSD